MIPNFKSFGAGLYRGGQPTGPADWVSLKELGVIQVIKLNEDYEGSDDGATALGIALMKCPIPLMQQIFTEPNLQAVRDVIGFITPGTFVHCAHGHDRTGLVVALFKIAQGMDKQSAYQDMLDNGFHRELLGLDKAWRDLTQ